ncbi:MAG: hypothetical protein HYY05_04775 [Chloroflexi bacterium]|nr:hypothetical protein [Chloroflexota bacterium]
MVGVYLMHDFDGIGTKMRLAQVHLKEIEDDFKSFRDSKLYVIRTEVNLQEGTKRAVFYPTAPLPLRWSAMLGEILYDMRSSLDHAVY